MCEAHDRDGGGDFHGVGDGDVEEEEYFFVTLYFITEDLRPPWVGLRPSGTRKRNNNLADMKYPIGC